MSKIKKNFVDTIRLAVRGGNGGAGLPKYNGVGGKGGTVYLEAVKGESLLSVIRKFPKRLATAESGENSKTLKIFGKPGVDKVISVPTGVTVYDEFMRKIGELNNVGERLAVAEGGPGGSPQSSPPFAGAKGHSEIITIDLKLIADVGLVGFPNAGKSTLLKASSRAKPQIAAYAFTTLRPNIGVIEYSDLRQIKMADLPGLIEGASLNLGMGHKFLKHVERSSLLLMVVDVNGFQLTPNCRHRSCLETVFILNKELELYNKELLDKPAVLAINKLDLPGAASTYNQILPVFQNLPDYVSRIEEEIRPEKVINFDCVVPISAKYDKESVEELKRIIRKSLDAHFDFSTESIRAKQEIELLRKIKHQNSEVIKVKV